MYFYFIQFKVCNNSQVPGPSKAILLLLSLPPALPFPFSFSLHLPCTVHMHQTWEHTCIPAAETIIQSTLPFRVRKKVCTPGNIFVLLSFELLPYFFFLFAPPFFSKLLLHCREWVLRGHLSFLFLNVVLEGALDSSLARSAVGAHAILFVSFFFPPLPRSRLLDSSQHCSVPLNVLTIKHVGRVLYLCSVFAKYENVSMQYQSDELRRVDQRQRKYLEGF